MENKKLDPEKRIQLESQISVIVDGLPDSGLSKKDALAEIKSALENATVLEIKERASSASISEYVMKSIKDFAACKLMNHEGLKTKSLTKYYSQISDISISYIDDIVRRVQYSNNCTEQEARVWVAHFQSLYETQFRLER